MVIVLSPNVRGCAQADSVYNNKERQKMRNFDIKEFHANNDGAGYYKRVLSNVSIEKRSLHDADRNIVGYIEVCENLYTPYNYYYEYDKRGNLRRSLDYFDRFVIGKEYNYDSLGHVTKTIDHDKPYKFSLDDLIKKMKGMGVTSWTRKDSLRYIGPKGRTTFISLGTKYVAWKTPAFIIAIGT